MDAVDLLHRWGFVVLGAALVLVASLINRFVPRRRGRIRQALILYVFFLVLAGAGAVLTHTRLDPTSSWIEHVRLVENLLAAFTCVSLGALFVFDLALPALSLGTATITADILVGVAYVFAGLGVLKASGVTASSVVTTSAVVSGVVALSLQATLGNIVGGVALQLDGSLSAGDWVELPGGLQGKVVAIRWRHTVLETRNWDTVIVPNANLLAQNIVILGKRSGKPIQHRMWVYFNVDFRFAPSRVIEVVHEALVATPIDGVAADPAPSVICYDFARDGRNSFAHYAVRYWLKDLPNDDPTSSRVRAIVYQALRRADIPLARPAHTLFMEADDIATARAERHVERQRRALETIELFRSLTADERAYVAARLKFAPFTAGETVTHQGAVAHWLYILCQGTVEIRRRADDGSLARRVATIEAPGFFGEMGLLTGEARRADVVALTDVECYRLDKEGLEHILKERPEIAEALSQTLAKRELELESVAEGLDEQARQAKLARAQDRILDQIQAFFGLTRTSRM